MIRADWRDLIAGAIAALLIVWVASWFTGPVRAASLGCGTASWYERGTWTASGARFNPNAMTAAMPDRRMMGHWVRVTYGKRSVAVLINDVGPARRLHRIIDLSRAAARALGMGGLARVCVTR